ncbi:MAG: hypothetical protein K2N41_00115 [Lachnospiraceae bacterium]|nr:hypothetical protein [Lachnospiraceae bacterium]MDE7238100.1 hypothetical protein [Lachnospiraceae bacterium]
MRRSVRKWICCLGAVAIVLVADMEAVHAESASGCGAWEVYDSNYDCRTPICDGKRRTGYLTTKRYKVCTHSDTGEQYTLMDTYVEEKGCCIYDN